MRGIPSTPPARRSAAEERRDQPRPVHLLRQSLRSSCYSVLLPRSATRPALPNAPRTTLSYAFWQLPSAGNIPSALSNAGLSGSFSVRAPSPGTFPATLGRTALSLFLLRDVDLDLILASLFWRSFGYPPLSSDHEQEDHVFRANWK